jgi:hypothetical protein
VGLDCGQRAAWKYQFLVFVVVRTYRGIMTASNEASPCFLALLVILFGGSLYSIVQFQSYHLLLQNTTARDVLSYFVPV